jgi:hypothetical protein
VPRLASKPWRGAHFQSGSAIRPGGTAFASGAEAAVSTQPIRQVLEAHEVLMRRFLAASTLLLASSAGCVIVDPSCGGGGGATILVSPSVVIVAVGQSTTPRASWCRRGRYDDVSPTWSLGQSADATIIGLDPETGRITGKRAGQATVIATYAGADGSSVQVTVR